MCCIFDIDAEYRECYSGLYTRKHLIEVLELSRDEDEDGGDEEDENKPRLVKSDYEYRAAIKCCGELCPMTFGKVEGESSTGVSKEEKEFRRLQILYYMIMKNRRYKKMYRKKNFSVFDCIEHPSQRYCSIYAEMIGDIWGKVSESARAVTDGPSAVQAKLASSDKGGYEDSIHINRLSAKGTDGVMKRRSANT